MDEFEQRRRSFLFSLGTSVPTKSCRKVSSQLRPRPGENIARFRESSPARIWFGVQRGVTLMVAARARAPIMGLR
jgi:hypothetical protein